MIARVRPPIPPPPGIDGKADAGGQVARHGQPLAAQADDQAVGAVVLQDLDHRAAAQAQLGEVTVGCMPKLQRLNSHLSAGPRR